MRILSWLAGAVLVVIMSTATAAALRAHGDGRQTLTASNAPVGAGYVGSSSPDPRPDRHQQQSGAQPPASPAGAGQHASAPPVQSVAPPPPPAPPIVIGSTQQALINSDRASAGLGPLTWNSCLYNVAVSNARRMAAQGYISHTNGPNVDLTCGLGHQAGENVGWWSGGINDSQLNTMFMNSPDHRSNIMGPYHYVATAWVVASNGYAYIAVEFG
jgi:uncharacterized protein YkwD